GISLRSLPTALREAVYLTRRIGIKYLWIDALCIVQGDEADWMRNAARMDEIYGNATLAIAAASAASCVQGVLTPGLYQHWKLPSRLTPDYEPMNHRSWTLQERLLSHRYLSFESVTEQFALRSYHLSINFENPFRLWLKVISDYTSRYLTNEGDKLPALSGIAKVINTHTGDQYLAGLWRHKILELLRWRVGYNILKPMPCHRPIEYRAPSWSWAAVDGNISLFYAHTPPASRTEFYRFVMWNRCPWKTHLGG
ncbi:hypothetical protein N431DRAFT_335373, partial [Stipitochalara longipes BDJ]